MTCDNCNNNGYIESSIAKDARFSPMLIKCTKPDCPFSDKYYDEVRRRYSSNYKPTKRQEEFFNSDIGVDPAAPGFDRSKITTYNSDMHGPPEMEMSEEYPNLSKELVKVAKQLISESPEAFIALDTPFGPMQTNKLEEANRVLGIIKCYLDYAEELSHADSQENVTVFPLGKALGMED